MTAREGKRLTAERPAENVADLDAFIDDALTDEANLEWREIKGHIAAIEAELAKANAAREAAEPCRSCVQARVAIEAENARLREALTSISTLVIGRDADASFNKSNLCEAVSTVRAALKETQCAGLACEAMGHSPDCPMRAALKGTP